jgi:hypothetical protein
MSIICTESYVKYKYILSFSLSAKQCFSFDPYDSPTFLKIDSFTRTYIVWVISLPYPPHPLPPPHIHL